MFWYSHNGLVFCYGFLCDLEKNKIYQHSPKKFDILPWFPFLVNRPQSRGCHLWLESFQSFSGQLWSPAPKFLYLVGESLRGSWQCSHSDPPTPQSHPDLSEPWLAESRSLQPRSKGSLLLAWNMILLNTRNRWHSQYDNLGIELIIFFNFPRCSSVQHSLIARAK